MWRNLTFIFREVLDQVKFSKAFHRDGTEAPDLVDVIVQNWLTKKVLFGASMSQETLKETMVTNFLVLYSKSRKGRWLKGETSGDKLGVVGIDLNCNCDTPLVQVIPLGEGVCHEKDSYGKTKSTCFNKTLLYTK